MRSSDVTAWRRGRLRRTLRTVAVLGGLALTLTACSSSSGSSSTTTGAGSSSTGSPGSSGSSNVAADQAVARSALIDVVDLGPGWTASGSVTVSDGTSGQGIPVAKLAPCLGLPVSTFEVQTPSASSPTFNGPNSSTLEDNVLVAPTAAAAQAQVDAFISPQSPHCIMTVLGPVYRHYLASSAPSGSSFGAITATAVPVPSAGDRSGAVALTVTLTVHGVSVPIRVTIEIISSGRIATQLALTTVGSTSTSILTAAAVAAAAKMQSAGG